MKGKKLLIFGLLMFIPNIVKAECGYNEKVRFQSLASNLNFTYDYREIDKGKEFYGVQFKITITNLHPDIYIYDIERGQNYYYNNQNEISIDGYLSGSSIGFMVYANSGGCKGEYLITNYVTLPPYNRYYIDPICKGVTDYKLCNRWSRVTLSYDEFIKDVTKYKEEKNREEIIIKTDEEDELLERIITFLSKYSFYLFGSIIIVCSGLIFYLNHKNDFDLK